MLGLSKRRFLQLAGLSIANRILSGPLRPSSRIRATTRKVIIVTFGGGVRYSETFAPEGLRNIPALAALAAAKATSSETCVNSGVLSHFNSTASILTGNWQRVDDFGFQPPAGADDLRVLPQADRRGSDGCLGDRHQQEFRSDGLGLRPFSGQPYGANVVLPKQLLLEAVQDVVKKSAAGGVARRENVLRHLEGVFSEGYEGVGWTIFKAGRHLDSNVRETLTAAWWNTSMVRKRRRPATS